MAEELVELGKSKCRSGFIRREGYTTKRGKKVGAGCVKDTGKPGKTPASKKVLPKPKAGRLMGWKEDLSASKRHSILLKANKAHGCKDVILDLNLLANYTKRTSPDTHKKARADMSWLREQGVCKLKTKE